MKNYLKDIEKKLEKVKGNIKIFKTKNFKHGFTLVELLVVLAIIGVLATLLTANFLGVRQRGRDSQRKSDLRQMQSALELYRSDQGSYPSANQGNTLGNCNNQTSLKSPDCTTSTYLQKIPKDPSGSSYYYTSTGTSYTVTACLENPNDPDKDSVNLNPPCDGVNVFSFTVGTPGEGTYSQASYYSQATCQGSYYAQSTYYPYCYSR